jgi:hypothetical protein
MSRSITDRDYLRLPVCRVANTCALEDGFVSKKKSRAPELISPAEFCRDYAGGIHISLYYRGQAASPPRYPAPVKGIPVADARHWLRTHGMELAKRAARRRPAAPAAPVAVTEERGP